MWISKKLASAKKQSQNLSVQVNNAEAGEIQVQGSNEYRDVKIISPSGISYTPELGEDCLMLPINDSVVAVGSYMKNKSLDEGEIMLYSGTGSITLKNDGRILINGQVFINGEEY